MNRMIVLALLFTVGCGKSQQQPNAEEQKKIEQQNSKDQQELQKAIAGEGRSATHNAPDANFKPRSNKKPSRIQKSKQQPEQKH